MFLIDLKIIDPMDIVDKETRKFLIYLKELEDKHKENLYEFMSENKTLYLHPNSCITCDKYIFNKYIYCKLCYKKIICNIFKYHYDLHISKPFHSYNYILFKQYFNDYNLAKNN
jgi:hypothetical protein